MNHKAHKDHEDEQPTRFAPLPQATERVIHDAIGAALAVHRQLGPGFLESAYERAMRVELAALQIPFECQKQAKVQYRGVVVCDHHLDLVVADALVVEIKLSASCGQFMKRRCFRI